MIEMYLLPFTPLTFEWLMNGKELIAMYAFLLSAYF